MQIEVGLLYVIEEKLPENKNWTIAEIKYTKDWAKLSKKNLMTYYPDRKFRITEYIPKSKKEKG